MSVQVPLELTASGAIDVQLPLYINNASQGNLVLQVGNLKPFLDAVVTGGSTTSLVTFSVPNLATQISQANLLDNSFSWLAGTGAFFDELQSLLEAEGVRRRSPDSSATSSAK